MSEEAKREKEDRKGNWRKDKKRKQEEGQKEKPEEGQKETRRRDRETGKKPLMVITFGEKSSTD